MKGFSVTLCLAFFLLPLVVSQTTTPTTPAAAPATSPANARTPEGNSTNGTATVASETVPSSTLTPEMIYVTDLTTEWITELNTEVSDEVTQKTTQPPATEPPEVLCNGKTCGTNEECVTPEGEVLSTCQCRTDFIRINETFCQDPAIATCETVNCGGEPASCTRENNTTRCQCGAFQTLKEGICVDATPAPTPQPTPERSEKPVTEGGTTQNVKVTTTPTVKDKETSTAVNTEATKAVKTGPTKAAGAKTSVAPGAKEEPTHKPYTGPIIGLFIFLVVTSIVFAAIYIVRKRKLRNNYGRLDEDSSEGGWSAFSKNPIYRGDRDYQPL